jgi:oxygen-independent coproporphyrinogen-3 oxidase
MSDVLARYARRAVPRYTSYPTAPHLVPEFPASTYASWLEGLDPAVPVSLYLHVPYCRQMCWYCGCNMKLAARYGPVAAYVESLLAEIDLVARHLPAPLPVAHLHWGGGTPTALEPEDLRRVMERLRERFRVEQAAEIAIETDPRTLTEAMAAAIGALGFTRASFGVQEFDPTVQAAINRVQPPEMVAKAVARLRASGVGSINFDLIYGLPYQTTASLIETIRLCAGMRPDRIALFGYAHVPWMARNQRMIPETALPDAAARAEQAERAAAALAAEGYVPVGLDHFALPEDALAEAARTGRLHRNFQGYTTDRAETLIPLGASAIGRTPRGFVQSIAETGAWARAVAAGLLPVAKGRAFCGDDRLRGHVIERLMCDGAVELGAAAQVFGAAPDWWEEHAAALDDLERDGLLNRTKDRLALTPDGLRLARVVASVFDRYLAGSAARHSVAV